MKKSLLLITLPVFMVLSSCSAAGRVAIKNDVNPFKEDTLAHAELFGDKGEDFELRAKMPYKMSGIDDFVEPKIGVQYKPRYEKVADSGEWFVAVRFVAAVGTLDVDAEWTRDIYKSDGTKYTEQIVQPTTKAYEALNGGAGIGITYANDEVQDGTVDLTPYNYYVVYTIYDIPETTFDNYYIVAHLKITDPAGVHADGYSKAMAARIGGGVGVKFDKDKTGYFLAGVIDGKKGTVDPNGDIKGGNEAAFANYFDKNDEFVIIKKQASTFQVWNADCLQSGDENATKSGEMVKINTPARYAFYLNGSFELWHTAFTGYPTEWDFHVRGIATTGNWDDIDDANDSYRLHADPTNKGFIRVELKAGDFKLTHRKDWNDDKGYNDGAFDAPGTALDGTHIGGTPGGNFTCITPGVYDIYLNDSWKVHFVFVG